MKIIQSFAQFDEGSHYLRYDDLRKEKIYLNFYVNLLSVLTLQKYYGEVTMYCNQKAYDSYIKYLPYKHFEIHENKNTFDFWNYYKVDAIRRQKGKFIHVDPDVVIFDDLFSDFINGRKHDLIVQDMIPEYANPLKWEMDNIREYLRENNILDYNLCEGKAFSNGVVGMTASVKKNFLEIADRFRDDFLAGKMKINRDLISMASEELVLYLVAKRDKLRILEILPYDKVLNNGSRVTANEKKYTHMWGDSKFNPQYIKIMKLKTIKEFPEHKETILRFEKEVLSKIKSLEIVW